MQLTAIKYMEYKWEVIGDFRWCAFWLQWIIIFACKIEGMKLLTTAKKHWLVHTDYEVSKCNTSCIKWEPIVDKIMYISAGESKS